MTDHCENCRIDRIGEENLADWREKHPGEPWTWRSQMSEKGWSLLARGSNEATLWESPALNAVAMRWDEKRAS